MQITIGDALTVVSFVLGTVFAIWALLVCFALLFPIKAEAARVEVKHHPWRAIGLGVVYNTILFVVAVVLTQQSIPVGKLIGWGVYLVLFGTMVVGGSGIALAAADRIQALERRRSSYRALERGAMLLVVGALLPIIGWFGFTPIMFTLAGGAGFRALFLSRASVQSPHENRAGEFVV